MRLPRATSLLALAVAAAALAVILSAHADRYVLHLRMADALGLRDGSKVVEGGVQVGTVSLGLGRDDRVLATLNLERRYAPVGRDASAVVTSLNLLGQKSLGLRPGNRGDAAPNGYTLPAGRVTPSTDLDQVLDVLGPDTRSRLTILIDEAGTAFTGRRQDFSALLNELPSSLSAGAGLLGALNASNGSLAALVAHSDSFVTALAGQRVQLAQLVDRFGQAAVTVEPRDAALAGTVRRLPGTLSTARRFLERLRQTAVPLGPAARDVQATAAPLDQVLTQVAPFTRAARPALAQARSDAPLLARLATGATPVLRAAVPTLTDLSTASTALAPVTDALSKSVDNIVATAWNWSRAVELRDGLSHLFRAEFTLSPKTLDYLVTRLLSAQGAQARGRSGRTPAKRIDRLRSRGPKGLPSVPSTTGAPAVPGLPKVPDLPQVPGVTAGPSAPAPQGADLSSLLHYLLNP